MKHQALKAIAISVIISIGAVTPLFAGYERDTIEIGIFPESIYDLDFANYSYGTNFWMWSVEDGDINYDGTIDQQDSLAAIDKINMIEISNAKDYTFSHQSTTRVVANGQSYWWTAQFCKATIYQKWALENYPFDKQRLVLKFENSTYDTTQVIMMNEQKDSITFKKDINLMGWQIMRSKIHSRVVTYNTDFGDPAGNGTSAYSRVTFIIELQRIAATAYFIKLCMGAFIAFLVAMIVFTISPSSMDSRFGLGIGALFAVAANKYVVDSNIPQAATNCLVDKVHEITFVYILLTIIASVISLRLFEKEKHPQRSKFDMASGIVLFLSFVAIIIYYLAVASADVPLG
jgi:hypothetical protein